MKILAHRFHHHDHHGKKDNRGTKKSRKLLKKMAKLEKKLSKYNFDSTSSSDDSSSSGESACRTRSHSRSLRKRIGRWHHNKHGKRFGNRGRSCDSSSSSSTSDSSTSDSTSSASSRSPSPGEHHRRGHHGDHGPPGHFSRSRSFAGRGTHSPPPCGKGQHRGHHHHEQSHHSRQRGHLSRHNYFRRHNGGIEGCLFKILAQSEPNLQDLSAEGQNGGNEENSANLVSPSRSVSHEPEVHATAPEEMDVQEVDEDTGEIVDEPAEGREIDATLADNWKEIIRKGLPTDAKKSLLTKYPVSKNCLLLRGPKINEEILPVATEAAIKRDTIRMFEQNEIGTGLTALGQAISDLNNKTDLKKDKEVVDILETLNEAACIILDAHHNMTITRQAFMLPELNRGVRALVETCKPDEFLYGNDFAEKAKNAKGFGRGKKGCKGRNLESQGEKGKKRKHAEHDGERRKSKRLDPLGTFKKGFMHCHHGPKKH